MFVWLLKAGKFRAVYFVYILKLYFELRNTVPGTGGRKKEFQELVNHSVTSFPALLKKDLILAFKFPFVAV